MVSGPSFRAGSPFSFVADLPPARYSRSTSLRRDLSTSSSAICVSRRALIFPPTFIPFSQNYIQSHEVFERRRKRFPAYIPLSNYPSPFVVAFSYYFLSCPVERHAIKAKRSPFFFSFSSLSLEHLLRNVKSRDLFYSRIT